MNNKNIIILLLVVTALIAGFYFMSKDHADSLPQNEENTQGKIDINAVCDGVLAYMTFPDGASADKYVLECKDGKHPEVIEQYKASMNLDAGVNI